MGTWRTLAAVGVGHLVSMGAVAVPVALGRSIDRRLLLVLAGVLMLTLIACHRRRRGAPGTPRAVPSALPLLASFLVSTAQGAGLMLVPGLMPLCGPGAAGGGGWGTAATAALWATLTAASVHTVAMLLAAGLAAHLAGRALR